MALSHILIKMTAPQEASPVVGGNSSQFSAGPSAAADPLQDITANDADLGLDLKEARSMTCSGKGTVEQPYSLVVPSNASS